MHLKYIIYFNIYIHIQILLTFCYSNCCIYVFVCLFMIENICVFQKKNITKKTLSELEVSVNEDLVINLSQVFQSQTSCKL